jgi:hypothetical protein
MRNLMLVGALMALAGCAGHQTRTTQMNPDCTQVSAEEQARGNCMYRPEVPEGPSS